MERYTDTISGEELYIHIGPGGSKNYYKDKELDIPHRVDGPAVEYVNGTKAWYVDGVFIFSLFSDGTIRTRMK